MAGGDSPAWQARKLLRAARVASLATQAGGQAGGQPYVALVTPATAGDLSVLLWLSELSEHTRHLLAEPRCAVMVVGEAAAENPQTAPRVTVTGVAERVEDAALKARWLAAHPYAAGYADFADFALWRVRPLGGMLVGGFARAARLRQADLVPDMSAVAAVAAAADSIMAHCNADHAAAMGRIAGMGDWRMVGVDVDGVDLAQGETVRRVAFPQPVAGPDEVRQALMALARISSVGKAG